MQKILSKLKQHRYFLSFILLFAYVQTVQERFSYRKVFDSLNFTPEAAVAQFFSACILFLITRSLINKWQKTGGLELKKIAYIFITSILIYYLIMLFLGLITALIFNTYERNFNTNTLVISSFMHVLNALIYGSFYLTYFYYRRNKVQIDSLNRYNQALAESKIIQLKNQINPHFLFNNLNVLDQLIEEDKNTASHFLNNFAELYRLVLEVSDKKLIPLKEEIAFAKNYFYLIQQKFGNAYNLVFNIHKEEGFIVPMTLQLLIENVIKHNLGSSQNPVIIEVHSSDKIIVTNTLNLKQKISLQSGKGLKNLEKQYKLLSNEKINIMKDEGIFSVTIPIIKYFNDDKSTHN
jgi:sensor histidine kinase YesM